MSHFDASLNVGGLPQTLIDSRVLEAQAMIAQARVREADLDAEAAAQRAAEASIDRQISEQILIRQKNSNRPSVYLGAELYRSEEGQWVARFGEVYAAGSTAEECFSNFDRLWMFGDDGPEEPPRVGLPPDRPNGGNGNSV